MGARQSKRSVDITTGKEVAVEGGEVAAGAGGEGKLERIEDLDTLKPQPNGDAHQDEQISDKEKKMQEQDERQENEKDNCNEKEIVLTPVVNGSGEGEGKEEEKIAEPEVKEKKPKKVKKKWSIRSISFSKKDKQKPQKKEETNGECEKVPEEGVVAAPVAVEAAEVKVESAPEKEVSEKEAETPVTEPLTNGSSASETPKDAVKQNGESSSVEEQPSPVEPVVEAKEVEVTKSEPIAAEPPKAEEVVPEVEALPINGLTIEEPAVEEVKAPVVEEVVAPSETKTEEKIEVIGDSEVCSGKEKSEVGSVEVPPPPLPSSPPPSSLTIFAESTMAPLDAQNVDASLPSLLPATVLAQTVTEPVVQKVSNESETLPPQEKPSESSDVPLTTEKTNDADLTNSSVGNDNVVKDIAPIVENVAVVSADNLVTPESPIVTASENIKQDTSSPTEISVKGPEVPVTSANDEVPASSESITIVPEETVKIPNDNVHPEVSQVEDSAKSIVNEPIIENSNIPVVPQETTNSVIEEVPKIENVNVCSEPNLPSPVDETSSPILQRASSDLDVSETMPPSDSFPPPPPPESCPESITETSVSESLPPPLSEFSVPDAILNSPTSETAELPGKDESVPNGDSVPETKPVQENGHAELNGFTVEESTEAHKVAGQPEEASVEIPQVKSVSDVVDVPAPTESVVTESVPSEGTVAE